MSTRFPYDINGIKLTEHQYTVLAAWAGTYHSDSPRTEWTITSHNAVSWGYDNTRSSTEPVFRALARKGIFEIRHERYIPRGWVSEIGREVFTLTPGPAQHFRDVRAASLARMQERERARQAEQDERAAKAVAEKRDRDARAMAVEELIRNHPIAFEDNLAAAYRMLDATAATIAAAKSIQAAADHILPGRVTVIPVV